MSESYQTIKGRASVELKIRNSRFIGAAMPVTSKEEAQIELEKIRKEQWEATHHCYAWRLAPSGSEYRFSDDGEPAGSAGKPILFVIQQRQLVNLLVVVTRYYGGTKLGVGGLVRAYTDAAVEALAAVEVTTVHSTDTVQVFTPYEDMRVVRQLVEDYALRFDEEFRDVVSYTLTLRSDHVEEFSARLTDMSQGRAGMVRGDRALSQ
jgi:uncharacterized YigZ family protein